VAVNRHRLRRAAALAVTTVVLVGMASACGSKPDNPDAVAIPDSIPVHEGPRELLDGFEQVTVTITAPDGTTREVCLLLAATPQTHEQGLMLVTDPSLGGYEGMLFQFDSDSTGGFWMKNTRLPLSIAYVAADGSIVSTADMEPCPDSAERCPGYPPDGPYRYAVEVVQGRLDDIGLEGDARLTIAGDACDPIDATATGTAPAPTPAT
jgi:uncharacterized membrane protein (UPF0127 family)